MKNPVGLKIYLKTFHDTNELLVFQIGGAMGPAGGVTMDGKTNFPERISDLTTRPEAKDTIKRFSQF